MGLPVFQTLGDLTSAVAGTAVDVSHLETVAVMVGDTFVGTYDIEVSFDGGATFVVHPTFAAETVPKVAALGMRVQQVRLNCTAFTSGTLAGRTSGTDEDRLA